MKILAVDTSGQQATAAILDKYIVIGEITVNAHFGPKSWHHSEILMPAVDNLFKLSGLRLADIDCIAYTAGPGSFTGLRIGASVAIGLAKGLNKPTLAVPTMDALAYNVAGIVSSGLVVPLMDARREQVYGAVYTVSNGKINLDTDYMAIGLDKMLDMVCGDEIIFVGDGADVYRESIIRKYPRARFAPLTANRQRAAAVGLWAFDNIKKATKSQEVKLIYVRQPQAVIKKNEDKNSILKQPHVLNLPQSPAEPDILIVPMEETHIKAVHAIETCCFSEPWSQDALLVELGYNNSINFVAMDKKRVAGYCSMRHVMDEGHINNIAVSSPYQNQGIGSRLMETLIQEAKTRRMKGITLEVRASNTSALALYKKYGFKLEGYRRNYYKHPLEDAAIMWKLF